MKKINLYLLALLFAITISCEKEESPSENGEEPKEDVTGETGTITDIDGNTYNWIGIGTQAWMADNLETTKYNDGTAIPLETDNDSWGELTAPAYCWYDNDDVSAQSNNYGALYNWYVVETDKLCPIGWHVPSDAEWTELEEYLIANGHNWDGSLTENKIAKSMAAKTGWEPSDEAGDVGNDTETNNTSGFSALPGGERGALGPFYGTGKYGNWWSTTYDDDAIYRTMVSDNHKLSRYGGSKTFGFSVRCVRD